MARNPALGSFPKRIRRHEEEIRRLRLRDQRGELPHQRFWIDPNDDNSFDFSTSTAVTGGFTSGFRRANLVFTSGDALAHWDAAAASGGVESGAIVMDVDGYYIVLAHPEITPEGWTPADLIVESLLEVNAGADTIDNQKIYRTHPTYDRDPTIVPVPTLTGTKALVATDTVSIVTDVRSPSTLNWRYEWDDGPSHGGFNTWLELIQIG